MLLHLFDLVFRLFNYLDKRHIGAYGQAQRQYVRRHSGSHATVLGPASEGQAENELCFSRDSMQKNCCSRGYDLGEASSSKFCNQAELIGRRAR
jgi:hypothetical protein